MYQGKIEVEKSLIENRRLENLWTCSNIIAAIYNSAGKTLNADINPKTIYDQLTGHAQPPPIDEDDDDPTDSLAELKAARRERERANGQCIRN